MENAARRRGKRLVANAAYFWRENAIATCERSKLWRKKTAVNATRNRNRANTQAFSSHGFSLAEFSLRGMGSMYSCILSLHPKLLV